MKHPTRRIVTSIALAAGAVAWLGCYGNAQDGHPIRHLGTYSSRSSGPAEAGTEDASAGASAGGLNTASPSFGAGTVTTGGPTTRGSAATQGSIGGAPAGNTGGGGK
jgi:hypothetical protein